MHLTNHIHSQQNFVCKDIWHHANRTHSQYWCANIRDFISEISCILSITHIVNKTLQCEVITWSATIRLSTHNTTRRSVGLLWSQLRVNMINTDYAIAVECRVQFLTILNQCLCNPHREHIKTRQRFGVFFSVQQVKKVHPQVMTMAMLGVSSVSTFENPHPTYGNRPMGKAAMKKQPEWPHSKALCFGRWYTTTQQ